MFCSKCGTSSNGAKFCKKCGAEISAVNTTVNTANINTTAQGNTIAPQRSDTAAGNNTAAVRKPSSKNTWIFGAIGGVVLLLVVLIFLGGQQGLAGTWTLESTTGSVPTSTPGQIVFVGDGLSGTGHFIDGFWDTRVDFSWNLHDGIFLSRIPGGEGLVGMTGYTWIELNAAGNRLTFTYPNGSSATFRRR